jgi:hypothetical protein
VEWLDKYVGRAIEKIHHEVDADSELLLFVVLPDFPHPVVFYHQV